MVSWAKIVGLTLLLVVLFSFNYMGLTLSTTVVEKPLPLILVGFIDTLLLRLFCHCFPVGGMEGMGDGILDALRCELRPHRDGDRLPSKSANDEYRIRLTRKWSNNIRYLRRGPRTFLGVRRMQAQSEAKRLAMHDRNGLGRLLARRFVLGSVLSVRTCCLHSVCETARSGGTRRGTEWGSSVC